SVESRSWLYARQRMSDIAGPVGVQSFFEACPDQFAFLGRDLGHAAVGAVDRQAVGGRAEDHVGPPRYRDEQACLLLLQLVLCGGGGGADALPRPSRIRLP